MVRASSNPIAADLVGAPPVRGAGGGIGLIDLLLILAPRKRLVLGATLAAGLVAAGIAFLLPNSYTAAALLLPPQQAQTTASAMLGQLGPLAAVAGRDLGLKTPGDLYIGLLGSRSIADRVIDRFQLQAVYQARTMVDARLKLRGHARFSTGKDSLVKIEVDDTDANRAAGMANLFASELNRQNTAFGTTEAGQRRIFLEKQVQQEKEILTAAEAEMKRVQERTGLFHVDAQAQIAIASIAQLKAQITGGEVLLQQLKVGATGQNPDVLRMEAQVAELRAQLRQLEEGPRRAPSEPLVATSTLPTASLAYLQQLRDLKYHEFLFEVLSKQYEAARIDENKAAPAIQVVDAAVPPDKKSGPHRGLITVFGILVGAFAGSTVAYIQQARRAPGDGAR